MQFHREKKYLEFNGREKVSFEIKRGRNILNIHVPRRSSFALNFIHFHFRDDIFWRDAKNASGECFCFSGQGRGGRRKGKKNGKFRRRKSEWTATRGRESLAARDWRKQNLEYESRKVNFFGENRYARSKRQVNSIRNVASGVGNQGTEFDSRRIAFCTKFDSKLYIYIYHEIWENRERNKKKVTCFPEFRYVPFFEKSTSHGIFEILGDSTRSTTSELKFPPRKAGSHARRNWFNSRGESLKYTRYSVSTLPIAICRGLENERPRIGLKKIHTQARGVMVIALWAIDLPV